MKKIFSLLSLRNFRFWLELIALPFFIFLVIHLAGHGSEMLFLGTEPEEKLFSVETVLGLVFASIFIAIWHIPALKKWIPCAHDHCHETSISHVFAIIAFCIHFFPEAEVRAVMIENFSSSEISSYATLIGFGSHFLVDIIVAVLLVSYFSSFPQKILAGFFIVFVWSIALYTQSNILHFFPESLRGLFFLSSAFLLAMFVHLPHRAKKHCHSCEE